MAGLTLALAESRLIAYMAAEEAVLLNQSYEIAGRRLTRADLADIQRGITYWQGLIVTLEVPATSRRRFGYVRHGF